MSTRVATTAGLHRLLHQLLKMADNGMQTTKGLEQETPSKLQTQNNAKPPCHLTHPTAAAVFCRLVNHWPRALKQHG